MASDSSDSSISPWPIVVLLAAAVGAFLHGVPFEFASPSGFEPSNDRGRFIETHLADDPFGVWVREANKKDSGDKATPPELFGGALHRPLWPENDWKVLVSDEKKRICILPVVVRDD